MPIINFSGSAPGEIAIKAIFDYLNKQRETMSPEIREKWDNAAYQLFKGWHNFWIDGGWPGEKLE